MQDVCLLSSLLLGKQHKANDFMLNREQDKGIHVKRNTEGGRTNTHNARREREGKRERL